MASARRPLVMAATRHHDDFRPAAHGQGEAVATWAIWTLLTLIVLVTYARLDADELYRVTRTGIGGGLSRAIVLVNFPIALIAIALVIVAMDALPPRAWWLGAPAVLLSAVTTVPGVVDEHDLDARPVNVLPALGVGMAIGLTMAAARRSGPSVASRRPLDPVRTVVIGVAAVVSIPWVLADLGVYGPEWVFIMEQPYTGSDGVIGPAVHLGHHHGLDGMLLVISAALLSRMRLRSRPLAVASLLYLSLVFSYGAVNGVQDAWNEQIAKRGWVDWTIPGALNPALEPIWLVIVLLAAGTALVLDREARRSAGPPPLVTPARPSDDRGVSIRR